MRAVYVFLLFFLLTGPAVFATHIVGGEITYRCLGDHQFEITLTIYRDCYNGNPWFDNPAIVGVYDANWNLRQKLLLPRNNALNDTLPIVLENPCLTAPPDVCVHRMTYKKVIFLPFSPGGYTLVYQRCCRNRLIRNLPDPLNTGISYTATIGDDALQGCNNAAVFKAWPPIAICAHEPVNFDHSATDPDGDSLSYRLCTPLNGPDSLNSTPNPPAAGPYPELEWLDPPYSLGNLLGGQPLHIDPQTGWLNGVPNLIGNFVVGVCVDEFRGDTLISTTRRDFQFNVSNCGRPTAAWLAPEPSCNTTTVQFQNESFSADAYRWYFDWPDNLAETSDELAPVHVYPDTGYYTVALIVNPGDPCGDTAVQQIHLTRGFVEAGLNVAFPDCDAAGLVIQGLDQSQDSVYGLTGWMWQLVQPNGVPLSSSQQNPVFKVNLPGDYALRLIARSANGCLDTVLLPFEAPIPPLNLLPPDWQICPGDSVSLFPLADPDYTYSWSPAGSLSDPSAPNPLAFPPETTVFNVTVSGNGPCVRNDAVAVTVIDPGVLQALATPDTIYQGQSAQLWAELPFDADFTWMPPFTLSDPDVANPEASPYETTDYLVTTELSGGCVLSARVRVVVIVPICAEPYIFFPTGFSPNADGANDELRPEGNFIESVYWVIYNRWGEKIFEADSPEQAWDGTYKGEDLPPETFGYYLRVRCIGGGEFVQKGNVTLLR